MIDAPLASSGNAFWTVRDNALYVAIERIIVMFLGNIRQRQHRTTAGVCEQNVNLSRFRANSIVN